MVISLELVGFVLFAALIAALVRNYDTPVTKAAIIPFLKTFCGSLIAAILAVWALDSQSMMLLNYASFLVVAGSAVGGLSFVRAIVEQVKTEEKPTA